MKKAHYLIKGIQCVCNGIKGFSKKLRSHNHPVFAVAILKDQSINIFIWHSVSFSLIKKLKEHSSWINSLVVLQDGRLVSGSRDKKIIIWDENNEKSSLTLTGNTSQVRCLALLNKGAQIASGSDDTKIIIWNVIDL